MENVNLIQYKISKSINFSIDSKSLNLLYLPIVGSDAISLYNFLINEGEIQQSLDGFIFNHERIMKFMNIKEESLIRCRKYLEAMGLISTYVDNTNIQFPIIFYEIKSPLSIKDFMEHNSFKKILLSKIEEKHLDSLVFVANNKKISSNAVNISQTLDNVFSVQNIISAQESIENNISKIKQHINNALKINVNFTNNIFLLIKNLLVEKTISDENITKLLVQSVSFYNNKCVIDEKTFIEKITSYNTACDNLFKNKELNRDDNIFSGSIDNSLLDGIISDYKKYNSEMYLQLMQNAVPSFSEKNLIEELRSLYKLPDQVINVVLDFAVFRSKGMLNIKYVNSIAKTIVRNKIVDALAAINYFRHVLRNVGNLKNKNKFSKFNLFPLKDNLNSYN